MTPVTWLLAWTALCASPGPPDEGPWRWPLAPIPQVVRAFEAPAEPWAAGHRGVDLAANPGQAVYAAGAGRVIYAARLAGRGVVVISHGPLRTTYLPVRASVRPGRTVRAGERIGVVEDRPGHCGPVSCLHWGALRGPSYLDPLSLLGAGRTRLLPVWGVPLPHPDPQLHHAPQSPLTQTDPPETPPNLVAPPESPLALADPAQSPRPPDGEAPRHDPPVGAGLSAPPLPLLGAASGTAALAIVSTLAPRRTRRPPPRPPGHPPS